MSEKNSFMVFSGTNTRYLAEKICHSLGCPLGNLLITKFSDGEFAVSYEESIKSSFLYAHTKLRNNSLTPGNFLFVWCTASQNTWK